MLFVKLLLAFIFLGSCSDNEGCDNVHDNRQAYLVMSLHFRATLLMFLVNG